VLHVPFLSTVRILRTCSKRPGIGHYPERAYFSSSHIHFCKIHSNVRPTIQSMPTQVISYSKVILSKYFIIVLFISSCYMSRPSFLIITKTMLYERFVYEDIYFIKNIYFVSKFLDVQYLSKCTLRSSCRVIVVMLI
jgi:hypothetical protein